MSPLLEVSKLKTVFEGDFGQTIGIEDVNFFVNKGEILSIVGESGCGKSVTSLSIMGLLGREGKVVQGKVLFKGKNLLNLSEKELDNIRGNELTMIFQDALSALNPVFTIGNQLIESIRAHLSITKKQARIRAIQLLEKVGLPEPRKIMKKYPFTLSGGMCQRVMIAMALSCNPQLLIADEPTTALDVTIQAQIMNLLRELQKELSMSVILITHDMGLVAEMADRVLVMYAGQVVEEVSVTDLFHHPAHPYTQALLKTVPSIRDGSDRILASIVGSVPEHYQDIKGCRFASRCPYVEKKCEEPQEIRRISNEHYVRCHLAEEISLKQKRGI
ncbi:MAG TPA: ABC transporter ATP-binding protein [Lachnospiraceae bacterium]|nr:ABC transporter ATP-binding protein [Lachnospiraceae bacterium]